MIFVVNWKCGAAAANPSAVPEQDDEGCGATTPAHQGAPKAVAISASGTSPFFRMSVKRVSVVSPLASTTWSETTSALAAEHDDAADERAE